MKEIEQEFQSNANAMGVMVFLRVMQGINSVGKHVYIYSRRYPENEIPSRWEVFIPSVKKAGTYPLPGGKSITYTEDFEEYPGASKFGFSAWDCNSLPHAKMVYNRLMAIGEIVPDEPNTQTGEEVELEDIVDAATPHRGRPKAPRPVLTVPAMEFSVKELAEKNHVEYITASVFVREALEKKEIHFVRAEQRASRGKKTNVFAVGAT